MDGLRDLIPFPAAQMPPNLPYLVRFRLVHKAKWASTKVPRPDVTALQRPTVKGLGAGATTKGTLRHISVFPPLLQMARLQDGAFHLGMKITSHRRRIALHRRVMLRCRRRRHEANGLRLIGVVGSVSRLGRRVTPFVCAHDALCNDPVRRSMAAHLIDATPGPLRPLAV